MMTMMQWLKPWALTVTRVALAVCATSALAGPVAERVQSQSVLRVCVWPGLPCSISLSLSLCVCKRTRQTRHPLLRNKSNSNHLHVVQQERERKRYKTNAVKRFVFFH